MKFRQGREVTTYAYLNLPIAQSGKMLPPGVEVTLILKEARDPMR